MVASSTRFSMCVAKIVYLKSNCYWKRLILFKHGKRWTVENFNHDLSDKRCSQQLQAIANPSEEEVALPSSSMTIRLLFTKSETTEPNKRWCKILKNSEQSVVNGYYLEVTFCMMKAVSLISVMNLTFEIILIRILFYNSSGNGKVSSYRTGIWFKTVRSIHSCEYPISYS